MQGLWLWTVTLFSFALFLRGEEPLRLKLRHLKLAPNYSGLSSFTNLYYKEISQVNEKVNNA